MTHKERLLTAVNHEEPDRVPICAFFTPEVEKKVLRHLGADSDQTSTYQAVGGPLPILMEHDFLLTWMGPCTSFYANPAPEYTDEWGIGWKWFDNAVGGSYTEMVKHPLADLRDPTGFSMPDFTREDRYDGARQVLADYGHEYAIMGAVPATLFELSWYLRGMMQVLEDLATNKEFMHAYLDRLVAWVDIAGTRLVELGVDLIWTGDDFAMQDRMMISPADLPRVLQAPLCETLSEMEVDQSQAQDRLSFRREPLSDHRRLCRNRAGHPEPDPTEVDGSRPSQAGLRKTPDVLG